VDLAIKVLDPISVVARHADLGVGAVKRRSEGRRNGVVVTFQFALIEAQSYRQGTRVAGYRFPDDLLDLLAELHHGKQSLVI
jgi:hypothetical protein